MWDTILAKSIEVGLMAGLFVGLLIYVLRDTAKREKKYQEMIAKLMHDIHKDVTEIKERVKHGA